MSLVQLRVVVIQIIVGLVQFQFRHSSLNVGSVAYLLHQISV
jgi:hypothetical protein